MTKNQIEYLKHKETQRSNLVGEQLTRERDAANRQLGFATLGETQRHNRETESYNYAVLGENQRHNLAQEAHNSAVLGETKRSNLAKEQETNRHNLAQESIGLDQLQISRDSLAESVRHAKVSEQEMERSNRAREDETRRANQARETELNRSNLAGEAQRRAELAETSKYHSQSIGLGYANVNLGYSQLAEAERSHRANEILGQQQLAEQVRTHLRNEQITEARDKMNFELGVLNSDRNYEYNQQRLSNEGIALEETGRHNAAVEDETRRHNQKTEGQTDFKLTAEALKDFTKVIVPLFG